MRGVNDWHTFDAWLDTHCRECGLADGHNQPWHRQHEALQKRAKVYKRPPKRARVSQARIEAMENLRGWYKANQDVAGLAWLEERVYKLHVLPLQKAA